MRKKWNKAFKGKKRRNKELFTFEKMDGSESEESGQFLDGRSASSKSDDSWSFDSNESHLSETNQSRKKLKMF